MSNNPAARAAKRRKDMRWKSPGAETQRADGSKAREEVIRTRKLAVGLSHVHMGEVEGIGEGTGRRVGRSRTKIATGYTTHVVGTHRSPQNPIGELGHAIEDALDPVRAPSPVRRLVDGRKLERPMGCTATLLVDVIEISDAGAAKVEKNGRSIWLPPRALPDGLEVGPGQALAIPRATANRLLRQRR